MERERYPKLIRRSGAMWVGLQLDAQWDSYFCFDEQDGAPVVTELRVVPSGADPLKTRRGPIPAGGLPARALRQIKFRDAEDVFRQEIATDWQLLLTDELPRKQRVERLHQWMEAPFSPEGVSGPRRPGKAGRDDLYYATVAAHYVAACKAGSKRPVEDAAKALGKAEGGKFTATYVRDLLNTARSPSRDLLTRPPKGKAGGQLTPKALAILKGEA